jgi:hypothetical protein
MTLLGTPVNKGSEGGLELRERPRPFSHSHPRAPKAAFSEGRVMSRCFSGSQPTGHTVAATVHWPPVPNGWQNCPVGQSQEVLQGIPVPPVEQYPPPSEATTQLQPPPLPPAQEKVVLGSQEIAEGGIQEAAQVRWPEGPLQTSPLQQSVLPVQVAPVAPHVGGASAQMPLSSQFSLQH